MYEAFSIGNIPYILDNVSENFIWTDSSDSSLVPHGGTYHGKNELGQFFQNLVNSVDTTLFEVDKYIADGDTVAACGKHRVIAKKTGKDSLIEWVMVWSFENGRPVKGKNYYDTLHHSTIFV